MKLTHPYQDTEVEITSEGDEVRVRFRQTYYCELDSRYKVAHYGIAASKNQMAELGKKLCDISNLIEAESVEITR